MMAQLGSNMGLLPTKDEVDGLIRRLSIGRGDHSTNHHRVIFGYYQTVGRNDDVDVMGF